MYQSAFTAAFTVAVALNLSVYAGTTVEIRGELSINDDYSSVTIDLYDQERHQRVASALAGRDGSFQFMNLEPGGYELQVLDRGLLVRREFVDARPGLPGLSIRIALPPAREQRKPGGIISVNRLRHKVPHKAEKLFRSGSIEALEQAVAIDPDYMEAHNNLACRYLQSGDNERALHHLQRALDIDPSAAMTYTNLAIAFVQLKRIDDAERAIRKAMDLGDRSGKAEYVRGIVLVRSGRSHEAIRHLTAAAGEFAPARTLLDRLKSRP